MKLIGQDPTLVTKSPCVPERLLQVAKEIFGVAGFDYMDGAEGYQWKYPEGEHKLGQITDYFAETWAHHT